MNERVLSGYTLASSFTAQKVLSGSRRIDLVSFVKRRNMRHRHLRRRRRRRREARGPMSLGSSKGEVEAEMLVEGGNKDEEEGVYWQD